MSMYEEFFHFSSHPFRNSPDPSFFYRSANHRDALAMLSYGIREGKGFMLVTGDVGTGKTMLVQALKTELPGQAIIIEIPFPWVSAEDILSTIRARLGLPTVSPETPEALEGLRERLREIANEGREVILVIDEAHQLPVKTLEGIRLISNIESPTRKLMQIVLLGQEELGALLSQYSLRQVQQRIALSCHLNPLDRNETAEYIRHRLRVANGNPELFAAGAIDQVYQYSNGCPRLINQACDYCLLYAFGKFAPSVPDKLAREALSNMVATRSSPAVPFVARSGPNGAPERSDAPSAITAPSAVQDVVKGSEPSRLPADLPIALPGSSRATREGAQSTRSTSPTLILFGGILLLAALAMGGGALWLVQQRQAETPPTGTVGQIKNTPEEARALPHSVVSPQDAAPKLSLALPSMMNREGVRSVETSRDLSLALLASQQYGAWNATIRDLLAAANPHLGGLETLPAGTVVAMPLPERSAMVVTDTAGRHYVYFGSFDSEEAAKGEIEPLRRVWTHALVANAERGGNQVHRVYLGPFETAAEAKNVAGALWFKFIPALSLGGPPSN